MKFDSRMRTGLALLALVTAGLEPALAQRYPNRSPANLVVMHLGVTVGIR